MFGKIAGGDVAPFFKVKRLTKDRLLIISLVKR